jgi:small nuclear ribonucleoprotein (snRNP)-like protein
LAEHQKYQRILEGRVGGEVMVWTAGGHYFRGTLREISEDGFLVLDEASCTCAGERHERDTAFVDIKAIDAAS